MVRLPGLVRSFALTTPVLATILVNALACSKAEPSKPAEPTVTTPSANPHAAMTATPGHEGMAMPGHPGALAPSTTDPAGPTPEVEWKAPATWTKAENPSPMRKATYKIPKAAGDDADAEMSITQVGGGLEANIERWAGQFEGGAKDTKRSTRTVGDLKVTVVEMSGTFNGSGMPGTGAPKGPKKDQVLLAAIADVDPPYFFKLVGGSKTIAAAHKDFDTFVASFKKK
ncbi:MAG: hypothetical protein U0169_21610 [Polyangiaceae bacterium]